MSAHENSLRALRRSLWHGERERQQAENIFSSDSAQSDLDVAHTMLRQLEQSWYDYVQAGRFSGV